MKKIRLIFSVILVISISFALVSCGQTNNNNNLDVNVSDDNTKVEPQTIPEQTEKEKITVPEINKSEIEILSGKNVDNDYDDGYIYFSFVAKNCTDKTINTLTLHLNILDKDGNIVDSTGAQEPTRVKPNQTINMESMCKKTDNSYSVVVDGYYYYCDDELFEGYIDNSPEIILK